MSKESKRAAFLAGGSSSEDAVRRALGRPRRTPLATPTDAVDDLPTAAPAAAEGELAPLRRPVPLRRWSVAALLARAAVAPPADGFSH
jgi:hypothetical protein